MIKLIKLIFYVILLFISFLFGVKYSQEVRVLSEWLFEIKGEEIKFDVIEKDVKKGKNYIILDEESNENPQENLEKEIEFDDDALDLLHQDNLIEEESQNLQ